MIAVLGLATVSDTDGVGRAGWEVGYTAAAAWLADHPERWQEPPETWFAELRESAADLAAEVTDNPASTTARAA